jgi:hypothetical protein
MCNVMGQCVVVALGPSTSLTTFRGMQKETQSLIVKLRHASQYSGVIARTERFKNSAMSYALNFQ